MAAKSATKPTSKTSTPKAAAKAAASPASASKGKKRVRVVEGEEEEDTAAVEAADTPKTKASKKSGSGVEKKDLRDKAKDLSSIEKISSKDAPKPTKGALKKSAAKPVEEEEEISLEDDAEEEEEIDFLKGFEESGDEGEDSSDEEAEGEEEAAFKVEQLPKVKGGKDEAAAVQKKLEAKAERRRNVSLTLVGAQCTSQELICTGIHHLTGQEWNHLPRSHPPRFPRGRDEVLLLPVRRDHSPSSLAQQDRTFSLTLPPFFACSHPCLHSRPVPLSTTPSSSSPTPQSLKSSTRPWTTTSSRVTSSSARLFPTTRFTPRCGLEPTGNSAQCPRAAPMLSRGVP